MFIFLAIMCCGAIMGYCLRNKNSVQKAGKLIFIIVCMLLYMLGISIGSNRFLVDNFSYFCSQAAFIAVMSLMGSLIASWMVFQLFFKHGKSKG